MKCPGCQTSFKEGERLIMQNYKVEYKNYTLPITEEKAKKTLLKTIVSFLNSKGGTIFIGVEDNKGEVKGVELYQKDKVAFSKFLKELLPNIKPDINIDADSLVKLQFVPVMSKKSFQNKYLIKIIMSQGDPSRIYCLVRQLKIQSENQSQNHQILSSYFRHNMGGLEEFKGLNLLKEIRNRAMNPLDVTPPSHNCNPQPQVPEEPPGTVLIQNVFAQEQKEIQLFFKENLALLGSAFSSTSYRAQRQALLLHLQKNSQFEKTKNILKQSLEYLNQESRVFLYSIDGDSQKEIILTKVNRFDESKKEAVGAIKIESKKEESKEEKREVNKQIKQKKVYRKVENKAVEKEKEQIPRLDSKPQPNYNKTPSKISKKNNITFSHLDMSRVNDLLTYLFMLNNQKNIEHTKYNNSLEIFLQSSQQLQSLIDKLFAKRAELSQFGFKQGKLIWGKNNGAIVIKNYEKDSRNEMKRYLMDLIKSDLSDMFFQNIDKGVYVGVCTFFKPEKACVWLDLLLTNSQLKAKFGLPGSKEGKKAKMKIVLVVANKFRELLQNPNDYFV